MLNQRYDIIINGGGIVGFTILNLILKSPHLKCKVLLLEQATKPVKQPPRLQGGPNRVSSITKASRTGLENLGVWDTIAQHSKDVRSIKVWNYDYSHSIVFNQGKETLGEDNNKRKSDFMFSVVENNRLSHAILNNIYKYSDSDHIAWDHSLQSLGQSTTHDGLLEVVAKNASTGEEINLNAPLVLGCDGFKSKVRDFAGFKYTERDLNKTAVVGTVRMEGSGGQQNRNDIAYQRFSSEKDTVAALLPLDEQYSSFVISAPKDYSKYLSDCDDTQFIQEFNQLLSTAESPTDAILQGIHSLTNATFNTLHNILQNGMASLKLTRGNENDFFGNNFDEPPRLESVVKNSRASFPLIFGTTTPRMVAPLPGKHQAQIALLGDSTHRIHPLAGQGLNLGIQDALELVRQLELIAKCGERVFDDTDHSSLDKALRRFELRRQAYIVPMNAGILSMSCLFKLTPSTILSSVNKCEPIKAASIKFANGC